MPSLGWTWLLLAAGILVCGLYAATETALTALGDARARRLVEERGARARPLGMWLRAPERVLSTLLVGNTLASVGLGALAGDMAIRLGHPTWVAASAALVTIVLLAVGEITPKTLAKNHPERYALMLMPFAVLNAYLLYPLAWVLVQIPQAVLRARAPEGAKPRPSVTGEEIEYLIGLGGREGALDPVKLELLSSVLEFADRVAKEVMVPRTRMVAIAADAPYADVVRTAGDTGHSRIPVYKESIDDIVGVLYAKALLADLVAAATPADFQIRKYLRPAFFVPEQMKISRLLKEFQKRRIHLAVVVDEFGGTSGIVTLEDVIEEIVGDIQDEGDSEEARFKALESGAILVDASLPLHELEEHLKIEFPEDGDYETLGGFLTATAGRVPPQGSVVAWGGLTFTVRASDERRVTRVEIAKKATPPPTTGAPVVAKA